MFSLRQHIQYCHREFIYHIKNQMFQNTNLKNLKNLTDSKIKITFAQLIFYRICKNEFDNRTFDYGCTKKGVGEQRETILSVGIE